jgi:hypothetical protein
VAKGVRSIWVVAAGLWSAAWAMLPNAIYARLDEPVRSQMSELVRVPGMALTGRLGLTALPAQAAQIALVFLAVTAVAAIGRAVLLWLDRRTDSAAVVRWGLRSAPMLGLWLLAELISLVAAFCLPPSLGLLSWLIAISGFFVLPLFCWRADIVEAASPPRVWAPAWPGWPAAGFAVLMAMLYLAISTALDLVAQTARWTGPFAFVAEILASTALLAAAALPWLRRSRGAATLRAAAKALRPASLRAVLAVQLRIQGFAVLVFGPPIAVFAIDSIFFMPQATAYLSAAGTQPPPWLSQWAAFEQWVQWAWTIPAATVTAWITLICIARALRQNDAVPAASD